MAKLREYIDREKLEDGDLLFPNTLGGTEDHYYRHLQQIAKRAKLPFHVEPHKLRKTGATLHCLPWVSQGRLKPLKPATARSPLIRKKRE